MARLPQPGGDQDTWGEVLNDFLSAAHSADGTLKTDSVGAAQLKPSAVASANLADGSITNAKLDTLAQTSLTKADTAIQTVNGKTPTSGDLALATTDLTDVFTPTLADGDVLTYDGAAEKWKSQPLELPQDISTTSAPTFSKVTLSSSPVNDSDAATKAYVDVNSSPGGVGAGIYRAAASADTASGYRQMSGFDSSLHIDSGYTVDIGAGTITVSTEGWYQITAHARFTAAYSTGYALMDIRCNGTSCIRGDQYNADHILEVSASGAYYIPPSGVITVFVFTSGLTSLTGDANGSYYYLRTVRCW